MNYSNILIRACAMLGLVVGTVEISRWMLFVERLVVIGVALVLWWVICRKTPLTKKA